MGGTHTLTHEHVKAVHASSRSRSFRDDQPSQGWNAGFKYRRQPSALVDGYQELEQRERFPGMMRLFTIYLRDRKD